MKKAPESSSREHRILDAAMANFTRYGFKKTTIEEIARGAGVGKGTVYLQFSSKQEILHRLMEREYMREVSHLMGKMAGISDPAAKFETLIREAYRYTSQNQFLRRMTAAAPETFSDLSLDVFHQVQEAGIALICQVIEEGMRQGVFRRVDPRKIAYILVNLDRALQYEMFLGREQYAGDELVDAVVDLTMRGVRKQKG
jgi:AcrR family transcriptional regulator